MSLRSLRAQSAGPVLGGDTSMALLTPEPDDQSNPTGQWLDRVAQILGSLKSVDGMPRVSRCAQGHPVVVFVEAECPVCALTLRIGYSEKWCDSCGATTAHVGGGHISGVCVQCVSHQPSANRG